MKKATTIQYIPAIFIKQRAMPGNKTPPLLMGEGASQQEQCKGVNQTSCNWLNSLPNLCKAACIFSVVFDDRLR